MIADVGRIMTRSACTRDGGEIQIVVEASDTDNVDRLGVENRLAPGNAFAATVHALEKATLPNQILHPTIEQVENDRREGNVVRISAQRIIDTDKEIRHGVLREKGGTTVCATVI